MKKPLIIASIVFIFLGCRQNPYSVLITNESSKIVSYDYNGSSYTINTLETQTHEVEAYTQPPRNIIDQNGIASIKMKTDGMTGNITFFDADYYVLNVINKMPIDIIITADNYIDNNGSIELLIKKDNEVKTIIYTNKPKFSTTSGYSVVFDWKFYNNEISMIIR